MAYTSSALSFVLEGLGKPVVLTGSQIPLCETRSDAESNLLTSLLILGRHHLKLGEVCVFFGDVLLRGNRATKVDAAGFGAFASPNLPPLGRAGIDLELDNSLVREPAPKGSLRIGRLSDATVGVFRLFPGFKAESLDALLSPPLQGLVLECYGSGNAPSKDKAFLDVLERAIARDVVIVAVSQPLYARADLHLYATGRALLDVGVVSGYDMTPEAALAKLFYLFGQGKSAGDVRRLAQEDLRGELTPPRP
jgi:L-asparaginase